MDNIIDLSSPVDVSYVPPSQGDTDLRPRKRPKHAGAHRENKDFVDLSSGSAALAARQQDRDVEVLEAQPNGRVGRQKLWGELEEVDSAAGPSRSPKYAPSSARFRRPLASSSDPTPENAPEVNHSSASSQGPSGSHAGAPPGCSRGHLQPSRYRIPAEALRTLAGPSNAVSAAAVGRAFEGRASGGSFPDSGRIDTAAMPQRPSWSHYLERGVLQQRSARPRQEGSSSERQNPAGGDDDDDASMARRLQDEEDARASHAIARRLEADEEEARLKARMNALEAMEEESERALANFAASRRSRTRRPGSFFDGPFPFGPSMETAVAGAALMRQPPRGVGGWGSMGIGSLLMGVGGGGHHGGGGGIREMMAGFVGSGLPPHMLMSDRDFTADDYDTLCRLDDRVENRKGANQLEIEALPTHVMRSGAGSSSGGFGAGRPGQQEPPEPCSICLENVVDGAVLRILPCTHRFHRDCIDGWLKQKATCPICQRSSKLGG